MVEHSIKPIRPIQPKSAAFFQKSWFIVREEKYVCYNKKAELKQRWPCDVPYIWCPENFRESTTIRPRLPFPNF